MLSDAHFFKRICRREWVVGYRRLGESCQSLPFYLLVTCLIPLALPLRPDLLPMIGSGIVWVMVVFAAQLSLLSCFKADMRGGSVAAWLLSPYPLPLMMSAILWCRWLQFVLPLTLILPIASLMYHLQVDAIVILWLSLWPGSFVVYGLGMILSALLIGVSDRTWLLALLLLPLTIPPLILATMAGYLAQQGQPVTGVLAWLMILALSVMVIAPWAMSVSIRLGYALTGERT